MGRKRKKVEKSSLFSLPSGGIRQIRMKLTSTKMAAGFGQLYKIRGQTRYHLSPMEQRAFAGAITKGIPNFFWRFRSNVAYWAPAFALGYLVYDTVEKEHARLQRKQPGQFDHEE